MTQKTNAARLLDQMGIQYELREYGQWRQNICSGWIDPRDMKSRPSTSLRTHRQSLAKCNDSACVVGKPEVILKGIREIQ